MHADADNLKIFTGRASRELTGRICRHLDIPLGQGHTDLFPDGEVFVKIEEDVRGKDCYVVQSTSNPVNAHLMELLIYIDCLRRASASRITAVIPYFGYARQDRKDEGRVPITAKLVANLITASGADRVVAMDLHAAQIQGFFDLPVDHLNASPVLLEALQPLSDAGDLCVVSPDVGNVKVASKYAQQLNAEFAIIDKRRKSGDTVEMANIIGDVQGKTVLMVDDMISTAGTICEAAKLVKQHGAKDVVAATTHGVFVGLAIERIVDSPISRVYSTDTIPCAGRCDAMGDKLEELSVAELLGDAIDRIHHNRSVSSLFRRDTGAKR
ncbi:MAG: ribose-phosphate pyrophosphokinase [Planctomycetota bacterium]